MSLSACLPGPYADALDASGRVPGGFSWPTLERLHVGGGNRSRESTNGSPESVRDVCAGRLTKQGAFTHGDRNCGTTQQRESGGRHVVRTIASRESECAGTDCATAYRPVSGKVETPRVAVSLRESRRSAPAALFNSAGLADRLGCGLPSHLGEFDSRSPLHVHLYTFHVQRIRSVHSSAETVRKQTAPL